MEWIIIGSLYQAKEGLYFYVHFLIELCVYETQQNDVAFL